MGAMTWPADDTLRAIETTAVDLARRAGALLLQYFPAVDVHFKDEKERDPVTAADHAAEDLIRDEVLRRFPDHGILGEERADSGPEGASFIWVIDPLDGTTNFINGLATFACSIGVLWCGRPVVGALFLPAGRRLQAGVYHARRGAGAYFDDHPIRFQPAAVSAANRLSALPGGATGLRGDRGRLGNVRTLGSIAAELALTAEGVLQFSFFGDPKVWDVAGGAALCLEAGAALYARPHRRGAWRPLERFAGSDAHPPTCADLRAWRGPFSAGDPALLPGLAADLSQAGRPLGALRRLLPRGG